mgnify:FL=1
MDNLIVKDLENLEGIFNNFHTQTGDTDESWMYMYTDTKTGLDCFKHSLTREYKAVKEGRA